MATSSTSGQDSLPEFDGHPYLQRLVKLRQSFPALKGFVRKIQNTDAGRQLVEKYYRQEHNRVPGRCYGLQFNDDGVSLLEDYPGGFGSPQALREYLEHHPAEASREKNHRRLFILEDMEPSYVDILGDHLGVDPLVFSEQMNTWNFSDSRSIPHRGLPSLTQPNQSFTLRYYEIRSLNDASSVDALTYQMTFAVNRRRYERWRDVDLPTFGNWEDSRHAFIRRCASFWTSQKPDSSSKALGWDAVIMVDPGMSSASNHHGLDLILQDPQRHKDRASLWNARPWEESESVKDTEHKSQPYHDGCPTLAPLLFSQISPGAQDQMEAFHRQRDLTSPLDELVFYWTKIASADLIAQTNAHSSNTSYYLLKHIAQNWTSLLELINCTVAKGEYFSDDYQAKIDDTLSGQQWKADLIKVNAIAKDINYMRRQMNHFWRATLMNLERLGVQLGCEQISPHLPIALQGAQKDFLTINTRLAPLRQRTENLTAIANDLANLRAAFKGIHDGEFSLRLGILASVVFPLTLFAAIFSMGENFLPGKRDFWVFWVSSVPFVGIFAIGLIYGRRPDRILGDVRGVARRGRARMGGRFHRGDLEKGRKFGP